jgi:hypothetical protein
MDKITAWGYACLCYFILFKNVFDLLNGVGAFSSANLSEFFFWGGSACGTSLS